MADDPLLPVLAEWAASLSWDELPAAVRAAAPWRVLDIVGLALAAIELPTSQAAMGHVRDAGGTAQASAIGLPQQVPAPGAAFVNGVLAHSLDYDDTHLPSILHPSASVVPAVLAAAELVRADGPTALTGVALGIELCVRLGMAGYDRDARQSEFFERGQHATSICGTLAAAGAAAYVHGLGSDGIANAVAIAASMGSGVIEANRTGGTVKRTHCGWAAQAGVTAAQLAQRGFTGPPTVLEGRFGFYQAWLSGRFDPAELTLGLGANWAVTSLHDKPYPANHFTHAVADAAMALRDRGLAPDDVQSVEVAVATPTVRTVGEPIEAKRRPESGYHAKFSAPYVFAAAFLGGGGLGLALDDFSDDLVRDPARRRLMDRVRVVGSRECDERYPESLPAIVTVTTTSGQQIVEQVPDNRGGPVRPLTDEELERKFLDNAARAVDGDTAAAIAAAVRGLDRARGVHEVLDLTRGG